MSRHYSYTVTGFFVGLLISVTQIAQAGGNLIGVDQDDPTQVVEKHWDDRMLPIQWVFSRDGYPESGFSNSELIGEIEAAFDSWQALPASRIQFEFGGEVDSRTSRVDGQHLVTFTDPDVIFPPGVVGYAFVYSFATETVVDLVGSDLNFDGIQDITPGTYPAGAIFDGNIIFNSGLDYSITGNDGSLDIQAIALHEVGHFIGLSHSSIDSVAMWPFLSSDVASARTLADDDIAYASHYYQHEPEFSLLYGSITGQVTNGFDSRPVVGAHVYATNIETGKKAVGAYTNHRGEYELPLVDGTYFIGIEPLDGDPIALDPQRINDVIANTPDTSFIEEMYDANEAGIESDPAAAMPVSVVAGQQTSSINFTTNVANVPGVTRVLLPGMNAFAFPVEIPNGLTAFELLEALGDDTEVNSIDRLNLQAQSFERAHYVDGIPSGANFPVKRGEGYIVHARQQKAVTFEGKPDCPNITLVKGLNLIGVPCPPATYSAFDLLTNLGTTHEVLSVKRYDPESSGIIQVAEYDNGSPSGDDFVISNGEAYFVDIRIDKGNISVPGQGAIFPPVITAISPGRAVPGELVLISGEGFDSNIQNNNVTFNGVGAPILYVTPTVIATSVPAVATSGPVVVRTRERESNPVHFEVEQHNISEISDGPTPLLTGQSANGELVTDSEQDRYQFVALAGAKVSLSAESGSADLLLALEGPSGVLLISDDDSGEGKNPKINNFSLPESGEYTIVVATVAGTGVYSLELAVRNTTSEPAVSVLQGDAQSTLAGADLPTPLEVLVTSSLGKPLAGVPVTFTAVDVNLSLPSQGFSLLNAGTTVIKSNSDGIAKIQATAPAAAGVYDIAVTVPGMPPASMQISTTTTPVAEVIFSKQVQDCGGEGCEVGQTLPEPYSIQYLDSTGAPVANVFASWKVVAGGGSLTDFTPAGQGRHLSGSDGRLEVFHTLGTGLLAGYTLNGSVVPMPQAVAASVPGQSVPVLFTAIGKAGPPANIDSVTSNFTRLTHNTTRLNGVYIRVTDEFQNPVKNALITASSDGLEVSPGMLDSVQLDTFNTNDEGIWVGAVSAADALPTMDEFGNVGSAGLASRYSVSVSAGAAGPSTYYVDVDMGPRMLTSWGQAESAFAGRNLQQPVVKKVLRYQRRDTFVDDGSGQDEDDGDWRDESFDELRQIPIAGVAINLTSSRKDGMDEAEYELISTTLNGENEVTVVTDSNGLAPVDVKLSEVAGSISIDGEITTPIEIQLETDTGTLIGAPVAPPLENYRTEATSVLAVPVEIDVTLQADQASGIDWTTFVIMLNGTTTIFDGSAADLPKLNSFPNFMRLFIDGIEYPQWPGIEFLAAGNFGELKLIYQPVASTLVEGENSVSLSADLTQYDGTAAQLDEQSIFSFGNTATSGDKVTWEVDESLDSAWATDFTFEQTVSLAQMQNSAVPATGVGSVTIGDFHTFHVPLQEESSVVVELLDHDQTPVDTLISEPALPGVAHSFVVLQEDVDGRVSRMADVPDLHIRVTATALASGKVTERLYRGDLQYSTTGKMLGQVIQHDTLIQNGSLTLSREDLALKGAGPQLNFVRSYSNARSPENANGTFGNGWSHNHEIYASIVAWSDGSPYFRNKLPGWIANTRATLQPMLMTTADYIALLPDPADKTPSMIAISNGGVFEKDADGIWVGQRGNHGKLAGSVASGYVYTSKDGTGYHFAAAPDPHGRFPVLQVADRNGNALTYTYEEQAIDEAIDGGNFVYSPTEFKLTRVTDQAGRYLSFSYARADNGFVRLTGVKAVVASENSPENIEVEFEYFKDESAEPEQEANRFDVVGMLRKVSRADFTETYAYDSSLYDGQPNLTSVTDAIGNKTKYQYYDTVPAEFLGVAPGTVLTDVVQKVCYPTEHENDLCQKDFATFDYNIESGNQRVVTDLRGYATIYLLNRWGNPSRIEEPEGKTVEYDWSIDLGETDNVMRFKRDLAINAEWEYRYDAQGNLTREIDPFGEESEQRWNQQFSILEYRKDKNGSVFEQVLDANGNVLNEVQTATVDGLATTVVVEHNYSNFGPFINLREWTENARNFKTYFDYDQNGNVKSITSPPDGSTEIVTHYQNDNRGLKVLETDPNGNATEFRYDALDRLQWQIDAEGNTTQIEYDPKGNKDWEEFTDSYYSGETVASKHTRVLKLDYGYDARDRVASVVRTGSLDGKSLDANGDALFSGMRSYTYDGNSNVLTETDWFNRATVHKYEDGLNRRTQTTDRDQNVMSYDYDFRSQAAAPLKKGLVKTVTDFNGRQSQEYYDVLNRLYRTELPTVHAHSVTGGADEALNYFRTTEYDKLNNVLATTDEEGNTTQFEYDGRYLRTRRINALNDVFEWHYDANGSLLRTVDEEERETVYVYNAQDRLSSKTEPEGHVWQYPVYRANGTLKKEIDPWGFEHSYSYDKINRKTTVTTPDGLEIVRYTNDGQLSYRKDAGNRASANIYGPESRLMVSIDGRGRTSSHSYDKNANLTDTVLTWDQAYTGEAVVKTHTKYDVLDRKTELHEGYLTPLVRVTHYDYDNMGNLKTVLRPDENNPDGQLTTYVLDELNRVKTTIVPQTTNYAREPATADDLATTIKQRYNGLGNVVWLQDRRGNVTQTSYDALQRVDVITDATAQANTIDHEYDKVGNLRFIKDKRGNVKESVYDGLNRVTEQYINTITDTAATTLAAASTREFRLLSNNYDTSGFGAQERQNSVTDAEGNTVVSLLDWRGNTVEQTLPAGEDYPETTLAQVYDGSGWLEKTTTDNAFETRYTYFADGTIATQTQVQSLTGIADEVTAYQYDIFGNQALVVKPKLNQQIATYDVRNRLALVEDHLGNQTRFEYDANNNLLRQFQPAANDDGDENLVQYVYDERNRKRGHIQHKATGNLVSLFDYDAEGNLAQQIDPKGHVFAFEYDALNRQRLQTYPVGGDIESIVSTYDANSNLDVVTEHKTGGVVEVTDHDYDLLDRLEQRVQRGHVVSYSYDNNGNRLSVTSPGGTTVNTFDTRNRLDTVVANGTTTSYTYLPTGWTDVVTHGNGTAVDYDYDDAGRTLKIANTDASATVLSQFDYGYDANGNRDSQIETQNGFSSEQVVTTAYVYDDLDRLESYTHTQAGGASVESHTYTYYPSYDRRTEVVVEDGVTVKDRTYSYDETYWVDTITEAAGTGGTISYAYDNNGNSLSKSSTTGEGPASTVFTYNSRNQLTTFAAGNAGSELSKGTYAYNYAGMRIRHLGSERGNIEYIYDDNSIIDELSNNTTFQVAHYRYGDRLLSLQNATGVDQFYHYAGLGTTTNLTDASGENQIAYRVDPFGAIVKEEGSSVNRQVFTGHEHDKETGLIYMKARFYDPDIARFINQDTYLGESTTPPSLHRYLYAYGNPTYYTDPTGNFAVTDWLRQETEAASNSVKQWADEVHNSDSSSAVKSIKGTGANLLAGFDDSVAFVLGAADEAADIALSAFGDREILGQNSYRRTQARLAETVTIAKTVADTTTAYLTEENLSGRVMDDAGRAKQVATDYGRKLRDGDSRAWSGIYAGVASFGSGAALKLGKAGASTATDNAVPSFKNNQATSAWTQNSSDARYVLRDIESHTDLPIHKNQRAELANYLRDNDHRFAVTKPEYEAVKKEYRKLRPQMIRDWEANTGQTWPKTDKSVPYQAHHIITERYGGANTWWNIHPARFPDQHQAGIHRADGATSQVFPHNPVREQ